MRPLKFFEHFRKTELRVRNSRKPQCSNSNWKFFKYTIFYWLEPSSERSV